MDCRNGFGCAGHGVRVPSGGNLRLWRERALSRLPAYSDRARPAYGELFRRIRRAFPVVGVRSAYGEVFRCMGYVMPSLRARPARVGSFENSAFRFGPLSDCPAHVGICSVAGACALWALGSSRLCEEVGTEPHGSAAAWGLSPSVWGSFVQWNIFGVFTREHLTRMGKFGENVPDAVRIGGAPPHVGKLGSTKRGHFSVRDALRPCGGVCYIEPNKLVLSAHVGRFLNGFPSTPDALAVPFVWGCFAVGAVEPPSRGLSRPRRGRMGETGIVSPPGGIRGVGHRRCGGVREPPFSEGQPAGFIAAGGEEV